MWFDENKARTFGCYFFLQVGSSWQQPFGYPQLAAKEQVNFAIWLT